MSSVQLWRRRKRGQARTARKRGERAALPELGLPPRPNTAPDALPRAGDGESAAAATSHGDARPPSPEAEAGDAPESSRSYHSPFGVLSLKQAWDLNEIRALQSASGGGGGGGGSSGGLGARESTRRGDGHRTRPHTPGDRSPTGAGIRFGSPGGGTPDLDLSDSDPLPQSRPQSRGGVTTRVAHRRPGNPTLPRPGR